MLVRARLRQSATARRQVLVIVLENILNKGIIVDYEDMAPVVPALAEHRPAEAGLSSIPILDKNGLHYLITEQVRILVP